MTPLERMMRLALPGGNLLHDGSPRPMSAREARRLGLRPAGLGLSDLSRWPAEPKAPDKVDPDLLARAMQQLCPPWIRSRDLARYARWIVRYGERFDVDPTLIAALIYQQSRCEARRRHCWGRGLAMINFGMYTNRIQQGRYRYGLRQGGRWQRQTLVLDRFPFAPRALLEPQVNIYFAAAFLGVYKKQCPDIDRAFRSLPHRHYVSHFIFGDHVRNLGPEDRILRARRRLLGYYHHKQPPAGRGSFRGIALSSPLDGPPRKVTSAMGDDRDGGRRKHKGLDFSSETGEQVHAVAAGRVTLAGADLIVGGPRSIEPALARTVPPNRMGKRGLLVVVDHGRQFESLYMHLAAYVVRAGQQVKPGQLLGYVGRTGMKESDAHLHLGFHYKGTPIDPLPHLKPYLFGPDATPAGRSRLERQRQKRTRRARWRRWRMQGDRFDYQERPGRTRHRGDRPPRRRIRRKPRGTPSPAW